MEDPGRMDSSACLMPSALKEYSALTSSLQGMLPSLAPLQAKTPCYFAAPGACAQPQYQFEASWSSCLRYEIGTMRNISIGMSQEDIRKHSSSLR